MKKIICLFALLGFASASVQASTFNFGDYASNDNSNGATFLNSLGNSGLGEFGYDWYNVTHDGVTVSASGTYTTGTGDNLVTHNAFAYMDSYWNNRAGLGVCKSLVSNQCNPGNDDNITANETLKLVFDTTVSLDGLGLVNGDHFKDFTGDFLIRINEDDSMLHQLGLAGSLSLSGYVGNTFEFISLASSTSGVDQEFYINTLNVSTVPLPAAAWLFGSALLGFFGFSRRKANT